jgi:5-methyltetrahydrofolate--homocysteine methyltransferase
LSLTDHSLLILDGACGTNLQDLHLPDSVWRGTDGCTEILNVSVPDVIRGLHERFVEAGAMVLETNSFGANRIVLAEYGLEDRVAELNRLAVEHARAAIGDRPERYVAGSVGPTTKLPSLGHISRDEMADAYGEQFRALAEAGVDLFIIETCQDLLQIKTALVTCYEVQEELGLEIPVMVSVTIERTGTMLVGTDIAAVVATFEPYPLFAMGLNCATGPDDMHSHIRYVSRNFPGRVSCLPNQGLPQVVNGKTVYPLSPEEYAEKMAAFIEHEGVSVVGGCCGTTPAHIEALVKRVASIAPAKRELDVRPRLSSLYQTVELDQEIKPLLIGERCNANGSKKFRDLLLADDWEACLRIGLEQEQAGAHVVDLCTAYVGRDELHDLTTLVPIFAKSLKIPLMIDSTTPDCIEACLKLYPGRCIVNSINLEDGGENLRRVVPLVKKYGASVVALTINRNGMAMTVEDKLATAKDIYRLAVTEGGLRPQDLLFDALTFTIGSGDETLRDAAARTLTAMGQIKAEMPGVFTVLGLSNVSFGLPGPARKMLNSVFLHEAVEAGMDGAIVSAGKILPLARVPEDSRELCLDLVYDRVRNEDQTPLMALIEHFQQTVAEEDDGGEKEFELPESTLFRKVVDGDKEELDDVLSMLLLRRSALSVINDVLVPAMRQVGELFGAGEILLPFVLMSAEVMKTAVSHLEPFMPKQTEGGKTKVLLATVQGDVHDIGKNLVEIILANNGYHVVNIGIKVPAETIIEQAREHNVDIIGLSGLLVKSALVMRDNMTIFQEAGLDIPILLGGAALTRRFVAEDCAPHYRAPVVYCPDAFSGLAAVRAFEAGTLKSTVWEGEGKAKAKPGRKEAKVSRDNPVPPAPFFGVKHVVDIDPRKLVPYMNVQALFRGRWGYRRGKMSAEEYTELIETKVQPMYDALVERSVSERLVTPRVAYGYYRCFSRENSVFVSHNDQLLEFAFPRQENEPNLCIADYFKSEAEGGDIVSFFVVTIGERLGEVTRKLFESDAYHDYLVTHGFGVEITDALAEYWHEVMRCEMGIAKQSPDEQVGYVVQDYQGSRYGFGYPACPDLGAHKLIFDLLHPEKIGVSLTDNMQMVPEQTTSAMIAHHPQAKYFAV